MRFIPNKFKKLFLSALPLFLLSFSIVEAQQGSGGGSGIQNPLKFNTFVEFLTTLLDVIITIAVPIVVLAVVYSGFLFVTAQGSVEKIEKAKKVIIWTLIGGVLVLGAQVVASAIKGTVDELTLDKHPIVLVLADTPKY